MKYDRRQENIEEDLWVKGHLKQNYNDIGISFTFNQIRKGFKNFTTVQNFVASKIFWCLERNILCSLKLHFFDKVKQ